jgi:hypothetical protein
MTEYASRTERLERLLSLGVGIAVIGALIVSMYQANLARAQLRASGWPYLQLANGGGTRGQPYTFVVTNEGVGPARIRSVQISADGHPMLRWNDAVRALTGEGEPDLLYSSFGRGSVIPAGGSRALLTLPAGPRAEKFWLAAQSRLRAVTCYCSVYDECWVADSDVEEPTRSDACTTDPATEFKQ